MKPKIGNFRTIFTRISVLLFVQFLITSLAMTTLAKEFSYEQFRETMHQQGLYDTTVMVPMRDGINLSTTIYKSPVGGPYPAILVRTPYGKDDDRLDVLQLIILKGYALVVQDVRGRYGSEGEDMVFVNDGWGDLQDGYDTVEWLATQSWCNGKIGTWGPSAMGITQNLMAGAKPPHLVCQVIGYAASNIYEQAAYHHGVYREALVSGWLNDIGSIDLLPIFLEHPYYDSFWEQINVETKYAEINVPTIFIGGWYDIFQDATLNDFVGRQFHSAEGALGNQKLIMGPWTHVNELSQNQGELK